MSNSVSGMAQVNDSLDGSLMSHDSLAELDREFARSVAVSRVKEDDSRASSISCDKEPVAISASLGHQTGSTRVADGRNGEARLTGAERTEARDQVDEGDHHPSDLARNATEGSYDTVTVAKNTDAAWSTGQERNGLDSKGDASDAGSWRISGHPIQNNESSLIGSGDRDKAPHQGHGPGWLSPRQKGFHMLGHPEDLLDDDPEALDDSVEDNAADDDIENDGGPSEVEPISLRRGLADLSSAYHTGGARSAAEAAMPGISEDAPLFANGDVHLWSVYNAPAAGGSEPSSNSSADKQRSTRSARESIDSLSDAESLMGPSSSDAALAAHRQSSRPLGAEDAGGPRVKFLCSFGGEVKSRGGGKLEYVGGDTRIMVFFRDITYADLMYKMTEYYGSSLTLKYQLPNFDLDLLISVSSDEDLSNMMEEFDHLDARSGANGSAWLRVFLFPADYDSPKSSRPLSEYNLQAANAAPYRGPGAPYALQGSSNAPFNFSSDAVAENYMPQASQPTQLSQMASVQPPQLPALRLHRLHAQHLPSIPSVPSLPRLSASASSMTSGSPSGSASPSSGIHHSPSHHHLHGFEERAYYGSQPDGQRQQQNRGGGRGGGGELGEYDYPTFSHFLDNDQAVTGSTAGRRAPEDPASPRGAQRDDLARIAARQLILGKNQSAAYQVAPQEVGGPQDLRWGEGTGTPPAGLTEGQMPPGRMERKPSFPMEEQSQGGPDRRLGFPGDDVAGGRSERNTSHPLDARRGFVVPSLDTSLVPRSDHVSNPDSPYTGSPGHRRPEQQVHADRGGGARGEGLGSNYGSGTASGGSAAPAGGLGGDRLQQQDAAGIGEAPSHSHPPSRTASGRYSRRAPSGQLQGDHATDEDQMAYTQQHQQQQHQHMYSQQGPGNTASWNDGFGGGGDSLHQGHGGHSVRGFPQESLAAQQQQQQQQQQQAQQMYQPSQQIYQPPMHYQGHGMLQAHQQREEGGGLPSDHVFARDARAGPDTRDRLLQEHAPPVLESQLTFPQSQQQHAYYTRLRAASQQQEALHRTDSHDRYNRSERSALPHTASEPVLPTHVASDPPVPPVYNEAGLRHAHPRGPPLPAGAAAVASGYREALPSHLMQSPSHSGPSSPRGGHRPFPYGAKHGLPIDHSHSHLPRLGMVTMSEQDLTSLGHAQNRRLPGGGAGLGGGGDMANERYLQELESRRPPLSHRVSDPGFWRSDIPEAGVAGAGPFSAHMQQQQQQQQLHPHQLQQQPRQYEDMLDEHSRRSRADLLGHQGHAGHQQYGDEYYRELQQGGHFPAGQRGGDVTGPFADQAYLGAEDLSQVQQQQQQQQQQPWPQPVPWDQGHALDSEEKARIAAGWGRNFLHRLSAGRGPPSPPDAAGLGPRWLGREQLSDPRRDSWSEASSMPPAAASGGSPAYRPGLHPPGSLSPRGQQQQQQQQYGVYEGMLPLDADSFLLDGTRDASSGQSTPHYAESGLPAGHGDAGAVHLNRGGGGGGGAEGPPRSMTNPEAREMGGMGVGMEHPFHGGGDYSRPGGLPRQLGSAPALAPGSPRGALSGPAAGGGSGMFSGHSHGPSRALDELPASLLEAMDDLPPPAAAADSMLHGRSGAESMLHGRSGGGGGGGGVQALSPPSPRSRLSRNPSHDDLTRAAALHFSAATGAPEHLQALPPPAPPQAVGMMGMRRPPSRTDLLAESLPAGAPPPPSEGLGFMHAPGHGGFSQRAYDVDDTSAVGLSGRGAPGSGLLGPLQLQHPRAVGGGAVASSLQPAPGGGHPNDAQHLMAGPDNMAYVSHSHGAPASPTAARNARPGGLSSQLGLPSYAAPSAAAPPPPVGAASAPAMAGGGGGEESYYAGAFYNNAPASHQYGSSPAPLMSQQYGSSAAPPPHPHPQALLPPHLQGSAAGAFPPDVGGRIAAAAESGPLAYQRGVAAAQAAEHRGAAESREFRVTGLEPPEVTNPESESFGMTSHLYGAAAADAFGHPGPVHRSGLGYAGVGPPHAQGGGAGGAPDGGLPHPQQQQFMDALVAARSSSALDIPGPPQGAGMGGAVSGEQQRRLSQRRQGGLSSQMLASAAAAGASAGGTPPDTAAASVLGTSLAASLGSLGFVHTSSHVASPASPASPAGAGTAAGGSQLAFAGGLANRGEGEGLGPSRAPGAGGDGGTVGAQGPSGAEQLSASSAQLAGSLHFMNASAARRTDCHLSEDVASSVLGSSPLGRQGGGLGVALNVVGNADEDSDNFVSCPDEDEDAPADGEAAAVVAAAAGGGAAVVNDAAGAEEAVVTESMAGVLEELEEEAELGARPKQILAEKEAVERGLQTILNADLEELKELGSGTYGTVYHGKWRGTDVAIKRIKSSVFQGRPSEQDRLVADFWREACTLSSLHHPNVVAFYGVVRDGPGGTLATVTEYMINGSLKQVLQKKDRSIDRRKRIMIAMEAAFGMEYLHGRNVVHFDLKCDNLLVNLRDAQRPICKVGDLGLSKVKHRTMVSGGVRGTLPWMAPELLDGRSQQVTEKVDVFSFGICMWELLTGEEPYATMHYGLIISGIMNNTLRPPIPQWCDPQWRALMERCWAPVAAERPSFPEIIVELRAMATPGAGTRPAPRS